MLGSEIVTQIAQFLSQNYIYTLSTKISKDSKQKNIWNESTSVEKVPLHTVQEKVVNGKITSFNLKGGEIVSIIPILYTIASQNQPVVFHVDSSDTDYSLLQTVTQTGLVCLYSTSFDEASKMAVIAHFISLRYKVTVIHFFDGSSSGKSKSISELISEENKVLFNEYYKEYSTKDTKDQSGDYAKIRSSPSIKEEQVKEVLNQLEKNLGKTQIIDYYGDEKATVVIVVLGLDTSVFQKVVSQNKQVAVLKVNVFRPWANEEFLRLIPSATTNVVVLDYSKNPASGWSTLFLDVASTLQVKDNLNLSFGRTFSNNLSLEETTKFIAESPKLQSGFTIGSNSEEPNKVPFTLPAGDQAYLKSLAQIFGQRLDVANVEGDNVWGQIKDEIVARDVDFGYGSILNKILNRKNFTNTIIKYLQTLKNTNDLHQKLSTWLDNKSSNVDSIIKALENEVKVNDSPLLKEILDNKNFFVKPSYWLVGNDNWAKDIGNSGIHNVIASKEKINVLILDTECYSKGEKSRASKKDIGLYAMNYGDVYVASVAIYSSYTQTFQAFTEADSYNGVSIVLAYSPDPTINEEDKNKTHLALESLKETKVAVDSGLWPLYRWNPSYDDSKKFILDSDKLKSEIQDFLKRDQHLSLLVEANPKIPGVGESLNDAMEERHNVRYTKIMESFAKLNAGLSGPPVVILYGSDGGHAEGLAKRLAENGTSRGAKTVCMAMNDYELSKLPEEKTVIFVVSTAGQGEFPANSKEFWKELSISEFTLPETQFSVFALGDRNYWPRPEEKIYFCKAGKDLDAKLGTMGGYRFLECGIGDDQDDDGYETGWQTWEPKLWEALNIGGAVEAAKKIPADDDIKKNSNFLRGTILKGLDDTSTGSLCYEDTKLTKFHGIYQQDDRDLREERRKRGQEKAFSFMVRVRVPGGVCTHKQWLQMDEIAEKHANGTIKITTRQAIQFHGIIKKNLKNSIKDINQALMDTIAACGDVNRNVMCSPNPAQSKVHQICYEFSKRFSEHLTPRTTAYHEIWLDKKKVGGDAVQDVEPLYGPTYLPRKFKVAVAIPPNNDVDVYAHCLGFIAIVDKEGNFEGFNVVIGGGMGMTHNNKKTYPCLSEPMCFATIDQAIEIGEKVMLVQRDNGERKNRKHARLKYTLEDHGMDWYREEVEKRLNFKLQPPRQHTFTTTGDEYQWLKGSDGKWHMTLFIEHGRVRDTPDYQLRQGLRELASMNVGGDFKFTPNQNLIISGIPDDKKSEVDALLKRYNILNTRWSGLRLNSVACVALPTCGLAFSESERYLPRLVTLLDKITEEAGLRDDAIVIRMSGCPNGCSRPYVAEIALVGRSPGIYNLYLGAGFAGERLNKLYKEALNEKQIVDELRPLIQHYAKERKEGEKFGDFVIRAGYIKATTAGNNFHDL